jgi:hypothetical protein
MKKVLALLILAAFTLGSCKKDEPVKPKFDMDGGDKLTLSTYD